MSRNTRVVLPLFFVLFLGVADSQVIGALLPAIREELGKSSEEVGFLFAAYAVSAAVSVLMWGGLSDKFGRRLGLLIGLVVFSFGSFVSYWSSNIISLAGGRVVTGMGASMLSLNTISYVGDYFPYAIRGRAMGSVFSSYFAALILALPMAKLVEEMMGWKTVFGFIGILGFLLLASTGLFLPEIRVRRAGPASDFLLMRQMHTYMSFFQGRSTVGALLSSFLASGGIAGFVAYIVAWLNDDLGISGRQVGLVYSLSGASALLASPFAGALSDTIGKRFQFIGSNLALALCLLFLPRFGWGLSLFITLFAIGLAAAFRQGPMEALLTEVVPEGLRGRFVALKNSFSQLGIGAASLLSGLLFENSGYLGVCIFCAVLNLAAAGCMAFLVRRPNL